MTREQFVAEIKKYYDKKVPPEGTLKDWVFWFVAYQEAEQFADEDADSIAHMLVGGIRPMSWKVVSQWLHMASEEENDPDNEYSIAGHIKEFYEPNTAQSKAH